MRRIKVKLFAVVVMPKYGFPGTVALEIYQTDAERDAYIQTIDRHEFDWDEYEPELEMCASKLEDLASTVNNLENKKEYP